MEYTMTTIKISGMKCQHCVGATLKALEELDGVANVNVDLDKGEASYDGDIALDEVKKAIAGIGFELAE